jgi:hypothetical protein
MRAPLVCMFLLLFALVFPALAQDRRGGLDRILPRVSRTVPGTFYDAEGPFMTPDGRATYRIKWMTPDGRIIWLTVDANSGQVMGGMPPPPPAGRFRNGDYSDRDHRDNWRGDDRGSWNRGGRGGNWNQGGRGGDRGNDRGGHDRRHGG